MDERVRRLVALVLAALLPLAACGDDDDDADGSDGTRAAQEQADDDRDDADDRDEGDQPGEIGEGCDLVTAADAEAILGEPVEPEPREDDLGAEVLDDYCAWIAETDTSFKLLQLNVFDGPQFFSAETYGDAEGFAELDGIGDEAFVYDAGFGIQVQVLDGDETIVLDVSGFNVDDPSFDEARVREALIELAREVVRRN